MAQNLLSPKANKQMLQRISVLSPTAKALWGSMDAAKMMQHCHAVNEAILNRQAPDERPTFRQKMIRLLVFGIVRKIPQGRQQPKVITERMEAMERLSFDEERDRLIAVTQRFSGHNGGLSGKHPVFGPMKTKGWGRFAWMHLDHHLRQFGV